MAKVGLVDFLTHCEEQLAKKTESSKTRKKVVGRTFSYSRSRVGTWNTFVHKEHIKVKNSGDSFSKGLNPNAPVFTPRAAIVKSVSSTKTSSISSRPPPVTPPSLHSKLKSSLTHKYNVEVKNRFDALSALHRIDELEDIGSNSQCQKSKARQDGPGKRSAVKIKKSNMVKMTDSKPMDIIDTVWEKATHSSMPNPELFETEKKVLNDQVCYRLLNYGLVLTCLYLQTSPEPLVLRLRGGAGDTALEDHEQGNFSGVDDSDQTEREGENLDCKGCRKSFLYGIELVHHLKTEQNCYVAHVGDLVGASTEAIVIKEVNCLFCNLEKNKKLKIHLRKEEDCRVKYIQFFNMENSEDVLEEIIKKVNNIKRTLYPSRKATERRKENKKGLDTFLTETALGSSVFSCRKCSSTGTLKQMSISDQENNEVVECKRCNWNLPDPAIPEKFLSNAVTEVDFNRILYPGNLR